MKKIIILKIQNNVLDGRAEQITIGFCNEKGQFMEWRILPGEMFDQRTKLEVGMELRLVPLSCL